MWNNVTPQNKKPGYVKSYPTSSNPAVLLWNQEPAAFRSMVGINLISKLQALSEARHYQYEL
jgi:hypothetical protein